MSKRTVSKSLVLVNWKGVFYEKYDLDRHVTALEGANGAGKTTVMIAAYMVLLPDMSRLRFTNVGETGATGGDKGIWGRLGNDGPASFAVMEFQTEQTDRLIAGVHLVKKGEPSLESTPFAISRVNSTVKLQDLFLKKSNGLEYVPNLEDLKANVAKVGAHLQVFSSAKEYFAFLFDRGVTPLKLNTDSEKSKFNEMLRTSMTGGISRALTSELRSFLLKEEGNLSSTLQQMKANLEACGRTRIEVDQARKLEKEIGGVYEMGLNMFGAMVRASKKKAEEQEARVQVAKESLEQSQSFYEQAQQKLSEISYQKVQLEEKKSELIKKKYFSNQYQNRLEIAYKLRDQIQALEQEAEHYQKFLADSQHKHQSFVQKKDELRDQKNKQQVNYNLAAAGLADFQQGIEDIHRRASAYRLSVKKLAELREILDEPRLSGLQAIDKLGEILELKEDVNQKRTQVSRQLSDSQLKKIEYDRAKKALESLSQNTFEDHQGIYQQALDLLIELENQEKLISNLSLLIKEKEECKFLSERQSKAKQRLLSLGLSIDLKQQQLSATEWIAEQFTSTENQIKQLEEQQRDEQQHLKENEIKLSLLKQKHQTLEQAQSNWADLELRIQRLIEYFGEEPKNRSDLEKVRNDLSDIRSKYQHDILKDKDKRESNLHEARHLDGVNGSFSPELIKLKDSLGAEFMASRFEDVSPEEAPEIEARLGSLVNALIVDNLDEAVQKVAGVSRGVESVWLMSEDSYFSLDPDETYGNGNHKDVLVKESDGLVRITRYPSKPTLGRKAREEKIIQLRKEASHLDVKIEKAIQEQKQVERLQQDIDILLANSALWFDGNPTMLMTDVHTQISTLQSEIQQKRDQIDQIKVKVSLIKPKIDGFRLLLADSRLLDEQDYQIKLADLEMQIEKAQAQRNQIKAQQQDRDTLKKYVEYLKYPPLKAHDQAQLELEMHHLNAERDDYYKAEENIEHLKANLDALQWADAEKSLQNQQTLKPEIEAQLELSKKAIDQLDQEINTLDLKINEAMNELQEHKGQKLAVEAQLQRIRVEFNELGIEDFSNQTQMEDLRKELFELDSQIKTVELELTNFARESGKLEAQKEQAHKVLEDSTRRLYNEEQNAKPIQENWALLKSQSLDEGLLTMAMNPRLLGGILENKNSIDLWAVVKQQAALLLDRLASAQGGNEILSQLKSLLGQAEQNTNDYLNGWLVLRNWLRKRLPLQLAEVDDPLHALERLRDYLATLDDRLKRQETELKGTSEDVAANIDVQIRKARTQVQRLNHYLERVKFGSIQGIRVKIDLVEKMEEILKALRKGGSAQGVLFEAEMPIEQALDEIFKKYAGGQSGGQRILDYREYIHLGVEIKRQAGGSTWEPANPTRLSTGEAIGVGAALMMVVLTEWERGVNLLRSRSVNGSLRLLFLDEANRLSKDNLSSLFDLCQNLDLQLIIAAPEVAQADGNTTYRLIRRLRSDGKEEVVVSGRKTKKQEIVSQETSEILGGDA
jgi:chromosome partition protein MukB